MTSRGIAIVALGVAMTVGGIGFAAPALVRVGATLLAAGLMGYLWVRGTVSMFRRTYPHATREVTPRPLSVGGPGTVSVSLTAMHNAPGGTLRTGIMSSLDVREQAAWELTGGRSTRAVVSRSPQALTLTYSLLPRLRGRWPLGPAIIHMGDPLGLWWSDIPVGNGESVAVWPAITDLSGMTGALLGEADRVALGARMPSTDDAALRDYREGDDLRRIHWASSARRGTLMTRSDERAGRRPVTVLLDGALQAAAFEWGVSTAASIAVAVAGSGHPTRLLAGDITGERPAHVAGHAITEARSTLLNQTLDLRAPASRTAAVENLRRIAQHVAYDAMHGEVIIAVVETLDEHALGALGPLATSGHAWAIMRSTHTDPDQEATNAVRALSHSGWRITTATVDTDLSRAWSDLTQAVRL